MYAHQVIENLKNEKQFVDNKILSALILKLEESQKFHLIDFSVTDLAISYNNLIKETVAKESIAIKMPYENVYIDGIYDVEKFNSKYFVSYLVFCNSSGMVFYMFGNDRQSSCPWRVMPYRYVFLFDDSTYRIEYIGNVPEQYEIEKDKSVVLRTYHHIAAFSRLLDCKNIGTIDNEPPAKLNKSRVKKGKQPLFTYKTLVIKPTGKRQQSLAAQGLWENRIHLCRGHFKEYTADKPLFGRFAGRYWWQPSVRGRNTQGVVMKDYEVKGGQDESTCG